MAERSYDFDDDDYDPDEEEDNDYQISYDNESSSAGPSKRIEKELKMREKQGEDLTPVYPNTTQALSTTFWGQAWNKNLMAYSDYASRMPRGRSYFRSGNVCGLKLSPGLIQAVVVGTRVYDVRISIKPLSKAAWEDLLARCRGKITDLMDLLEGNLSNDVLREFTDLESGMFPTDREIKLGCTCPDWADMCTHCAATLYAVGTLLDENPQHFFTLRKVDPADLIGTVSDTINLITTPSTQDSERNAALEGADLMDIFGIQLSETTDTPPPEIAKPRAAKKRRISPT